MKKSRVRTPQRRAILYAKNPYCCYCGILTIQYHELYKRGAQKGEPFPSDMATLEHLYDKFDYEQRVQAGLRGDDSRHAIACFKCNQSRGMQRMKTLPKEILEKRKIYLASLRNGKIRL